MNMTITKTEMQVRKEKVRTDEYKERQTIKKTEIVSTVCVFICLSLQCVFFNFNAVRKKNRKPIIFLLFEKLCF